MIPTPLTQPDNILTEELITYTKRCIWKFFSIYKVFTEDREDVEQDVFVGVIEALSSWKYQPSKCADQAEATYPEAIRKFIHVVVQYHIKNHIVYKTRECRTGIVLKFVSDSQERYDGQVNVILESELAGPIDNGPDTEANRRLLIEDIFTKVMPDCHPDVKELAHMILTTGDSKNQVFRRYSDRHNIPHHTCDYRWKELQFRCHNAFSGRLDGTYIENALNSAVRYLSDSLYNPGGWDIIPSPKLRDRKGTPPVKPMPIDPFAPSTLQDEMGRDNYKRRNRFKTNRKQRASRALATA